MPGPRVGAAHVGPCSRVPCFATAAATGLTGEDFAWKLLKEENVVTMPGESFGAGGAGHVRVALTVDDIQIAEAAKRIVRLAEKIG